jgi:hypothetical protein
MEDDWPHCAAGRDRNAAADPSTRTVSHIGTSPIDHRTDWPVLDEVAQLVDEGPPTALFSRRPSKSERRNAAQA